MKTFIKLVCSSSMAIALAACGDDGGTPATPDGPPVAAMGCELYCTQTTTNCTGDNAQYVDMADCMSYCAEAAWPAGADGVMSGNSLACRIYHGGTPAMGSPGLHCPHAGPTGDEVCGAVDFRTDVATAYTRVDAMGMPAVATAIVSSGMKNAYNDASPDSSGFAVEFLTNINAIHSLIGPGGGEPAGLNDDLAALGLDACDGSVAAFQGGAEDSCAGQLLAPSFPVANLVLGTDDLDINPANPAGFPNGRALADQVIDVTLAVLLLDMGGTCGAAVCSPGTLAGLPLNPPANDVAFATTFPYVAPAHAP
ncbi:MAG: DUF4331 family protein [Kofleriaceae bacterium]|nr:DUF4331 family protein [Kofleriaceae bacterium]